MPTYKFTITAPATQSAEVEIVADTIEEAREIALSPASFQAPDKAKFAFDDGNVIEDVYLPDEDAFEVVDTLKP